MDAALKYSGSEQEGKAAALSFEVEVGGREILSFAPSTKKGKTLNLSSVFPQSIWWGSACDHCCHMSPKTESKSPLRKTFLTTTNKTKQFVFRVPRSQAPSPPLRQAIGN